MTAAPGRPCGWAAPRARLGPVVRAVGLPGPRADRCRLEPRRRRARASRRRRARRRPVRGAGAARTLGSAAAQPAHRPALRRGAGGRDAFRVLLGRRGDGRRPGAADRVHRARRDRRVAVAAPRGAAAPADARGRRHRRRRAPARPRPAVGRRPGPRRRVVGARGDARRRDVLRHVRRHAQRRATARAGGRRPRGGRGRPGRARPRRRPADAGTTSAPTYAGGAVPCGCPSSASAWSRRRSPTRPASRRACGSARGWPRSWRCSRCSPRSSSRGRCSTSSRGRCSSSAARSSSRRHRRQARRAPSAPGRSPPRDPCFPSRRPSRWFPARPNGIERGWQLARVLGSPGPGFLGAGTGTVQRGARTRAPLRSPVELA